MRSLYLSKNKVIKNLFLISIFFYIGQGSVIPKGTWLTQIFFLIILSISTYCVFKSFAIDGKRNHFLYIWTFFLFINVIGYFLTLDLKNIFYFGQIKVILFFILVFYPFYFYTRLNLISNKDIIYFFFCMFFLSFLDFNNNYNEIISQKNNYDVNVVNNSAYYFSALIPFIFLFKRKIFGLFSLILILLFVIQGSKRGALVVALLGALIFFCYYLTSIDGKQKILKYIASTFILILVAQYLIGYFYENIYLIERLTTISDGGSGRDIIYINLIENWMNTDSLINFIFGFGFSSTIEFSGSGHFAHNDWLELMTNFGIIGLLSYIFIFLYIAYTVFWGKLGYEYKTTLLCIMLMWLLTTLFSMVYTSYSGVFFSSLLGFIIATKFNKF